jgi:2-C-methyl-D-erythritol 4-phosphate cytidylyltransferase
LNDFIALIPAAGFGTRFNDERPKALVKLSGKPLIVHVLERFLAAGRISRAVLAVQESHEEMFRKALKNVALPWTLTNGGLSRKASVANAFKVAAPGPDDFICVHDAARPLIDPLEVAAVLDAAEETGAAIAGFMMTDTIKRVRSGSIVETVPRNDLVAATTPQVFRAGLFARALEADPGGEATDDAQIVERLGVEVRVVLTSRWNLKITFPEDLAAAEAFLVYSKKSGV